MLTKNIRNYISMHSQSLQQIPLEMILDLTEEGLYKYEKDKYQYVHIPGTKRSMVAIHHSEIIGDYPVSAEDLWNYTASNFKSMLELPVNVQQYFYTVMNYVLDELVYIQKATTDVSQFDKNLENMILTDSAYRAILKEVLHLIDSYLVLHVDIRVIIKHLFNKKSDTFQNRELYRKLLNYINVVNTVVHPDIIRDSTRRETELKRFITETSLKLGDVMNGSSSREIHDCLDTLIEDNKVNPEIAKMLKEALIPADKAQLAESYHKSYKEFINSPVVDFSTINLSPETLFTAESYFWISMIKNLAFYLGHFNFVKSVKADESKIFSSINFPNVETILTIDIEKLRNYVNSGVRNSRYDCILMLFLRNLLINYYENNKQHGPISAVGGALESFELNYAIPEGIDLTYDNICNHGVGFIHLHINSNYMLLCQSATQEELIKARLMH